MLGKTIMAAALLACAAALGGEPGAGGDVQPRKYYGKVAVRLGNMLPRYHVLQQALDDEISRRAWTNLVTYYDFDHSVFLQGDLDRFAARAEQLDDELLSGDVSFGYDVHNLYVKRLRERILFATNLLARGEWDFSTNETYRTRRKDAPWPATTAEAEDHWRRRMKNEVLAWVLAKELDAEDEAAKKARRAARPAKRKAKDDAPAATNAAPVATNAVPVATNAVPVATNAVPVATNAVPVATNAVPVATNAVPAVTNVLVEAARELIKKYRQYTQTLTEPDEEAVLQHYLSALARAYDPHTDYMSPVTKEDFDMEMNLTLCGVGAVLSMEDGALKIVEIMPGGPVDRDGRIKEGDKIVGVAQEGGPMVDVMWKPMHRSIQKIRGPKGTRVTLEIIPRSDATGATRRRIELVRDEIKLEDQAATGRVERVRADGVARKLGYVYLPGFYGTMDKRRGERGFRSCAMDVAKYLADFNAQDVQGLVLDLRGNGGGSLREAVMLSALFVPEGPVVQIRDQRTVGSLPIPSGNPVAFRKPMVILTDRASASASEIVAGHLQDVGRAVVLGDSRTHGKGTVQTVLGLGPDKYGSTKITTARFYRINGRSTQVEGVAADIRLPSLLDGLDVGEDKLTYALPFSRILPADYAKCWDLDAKVPELRALSAARLKGNARYQRHVENVEGMKRMSDRTVVSLERAARKEMMRGDRALRELDAEAEDEDDEVAAAEKASKPARRKRNERAKDDVVLDEAWQVLSDLVRLTGGAELPASDWN